MKQPKSPSRAPELRVVKSPKRKPRIFRCSADGCEAAKEQRGEWDPVPAGWVLVFTRPTKQEDGVYHFCEEHSPMHLVSAQGRWKAQKAVGS